MHNYIKDLESALKETFLEINSNNVAVAFSGGTDSSIIAYISKNFKKIMLYTVGTKNSYDIINADNTAKLLNLELKEIIITKNDIKKAIPKISKILGTIDVVKISFELPIFFVVNKCEEKVLLSGQGADELFGGYAKYLDINLEDLNKRLENDVIELKDRIFEKKIANYFNKEIHLPFLNSKFVQIALNIPAKYKIRDMERKYILRQMGKSIGLPDEIIKKKKKAAQYSSGIMKTIKQLAKEDKCDLQGYIKKLIKLEN